MAHRFLPLMTAAASLAAMSLVHATKANAFPPVPPETAIEFYHAGFDHYFITQNPVEIDNLDSGRTVGWTRTGRGFMVFPSQASGAGVSPVCRFYIPPEHGDSHFFSASPAECADVLNKIPIDGISATISTNRRTLSHAVARVDYRKSGDRSPCWLWNQHLIPTATPPIPASRRR
jgi:hypothetical protein